jgi:hypothetical protein
MSSSDTADATWRKSTYSTAQGSCVEVGIIPRRKSTYSNAQGSCVEAGSVPRLVLVRDTTQHGNGPVVSISSASWRRFTASIRAAAAIR